MGFSETFRIALAGVASNKFRSFLTLLGIIIGVSAVILMVSLGSGTQAVVKGQFSSLQTRQIYVGSNYELPYLKRGKLTLADGQYLKESTVGSEKVIPFYRFQLNVKYNKKEKRNLVAGVVSESRDLTGLEIKYGRYIQASDVKNRERVAVVGEKFLRELVKLEDYSSLVGKYIYVDGKKLLLIGILAETESNVLISDNSVLIPLSTVRDLWRRRTRYLNSFLISYDQSTTENDMISQVKYLLNRKYGKTNSGKSRFRLQGLQGQTNIFTRIVQVFTYVLGGIAAISLLVGGIGVMNIMLVTVKERTREIGLRLAIGATRSDIRKQFVTESILLAVGGGLIGIITGGSLSMLANFFIGKFFNWWQGSIPLWIMIISFVVTVAIGIIFGFYPAYRASKLDPIEALRYE